MMHNKAFTLVELIVVITILAVLGTIAFVSFQGYAASSRDSVRITDLKNIDKVLKLKVTAGETLLLPEQALKITASGTTLSYQGNMSEKLLNHYGITNGGLDPLDNIPYTYSVNENRNKYQLLGFLETGDSIVLNLNQTFADNSQRFPKTTGDTLGILLDETTNIPLVESGSTTELDIETTADTYGLIIQNTTSIQKGDKEFLTSELDFKIHTKGSCKNILLNGLSKGDGIYKINPTGNDEMEVYCDMTTDGGGWTLYYANSGNPLMKTKKAYKHYLVDKGGIDFSVYNYKDFDLNGVIDFGRLEAKEVMVKEIGALGMNEFGTITFERKNTLNKFLEHTLNIENPVNPDIYIDCQLLPNNEYFNYRNSNGVNYKYNKISHWIYLTSYMGYGWRDCMIEDGIPGISPQSSGSDIEDYPRHFYYNILNAADSQRTRGVGGFNNGNADAIARYFIR